MANALTAVAMAAAHGVQAETIRLALATFGTSFEQNPGRLNLFDGHGFRVIMDYAHNPAGLMALGDLLQKLRPSYGRQIGMVTVPGDRRGRLAAATSTGGTGGSKAGRVGDSPLPGLGVYANKAAAISATGQGESIARAMLGARCVIAMENGAEPQEAVEQALSYLEGLPPHSGMIALDAAGRIGWSHTGDQMALAWATGEAPDFRIEISGLEDAEDA